jgi:hypothetical protein
MKPEVDHAAARHGLSRAAAEVLFQALVAGGGHQAQFSHPELGGMGQWSGGMTQIGAMFDDALKAKVGGFCRDVAPVARRAAERAGERDASGSSSPSVNWWPAGLGTPASAGAQGGLRYACFPDSRRLAIERDGRTTLYDTGRHRLTGFAQQQGAATSLTFSGPDGPVALEDLTVVAS